MLRALLAKINVAMVSGMVFRNFFGGNFFSGHTPTGRKRRFSGILARFGLGRLQKFRARRKKQKCNYPVLEALFGGKSVRPESFSPKLCNSFLPFPLWPAGRPGKYWLGLGPRTALGTQRNSGRKTEKTQFRGFNLCVTKKIKTHPLQLGPNTQS